MFSNNNRDLLTDEPCYKCCYFMDLRCTKYGVFPFTLGKGPSRCKQCVNECGKGPDCDTNEGRAIIKARIDQLNNKD